MAWIDAKETLDRQNIAIKNKREKEKINTHIIKLENMSTEEGAKPLNIMPKEEDVERLEISMGSVQNEILEYIT